MGSGPEWTAMPRVWASCPWEEGQRDEQARPATEHAGAAPTGLLHLNDSPCLSTGGYGASTRVWQMGTDSNQNQTDRGSSLTSAAYSHGHE